MKAKRKKKPDLQKIEQELVALERRLTLELQEHLGNVQNTSRDDPTDFFDIAAEGEIDYMSALSAETGSATIDEVQQALRKLSEGTYGICDACGKSIKKRRLKARLFAVLCIGCKEREEGMGYAEGSRTLSARGDYGIAVSLTDEDVHASESPGDQVLRNIEDVEIGELY